MKEASELKQQRYRWATSAGYPNGSSAKNTALFWSRPLKDEKTIFITEGGLKASVASHLSGDLFVAIPGVSCIATFKDLLQVCKKKRNLSCRSFRYGWQTASKRS